MFASRAIHNGAKTASQSSTKLRRGLATASASDVEQARRYCLKQLQHGDYESYLVRQFIPRAARNAYDALRTLNLELARLPETVSNPAIAAFRMQFWRDTVNSTFAGTPPREPISILLHQAIADVLSHPHDTSSAKSLKFWLLRFINTREQSMDNRPFPSLAALEEYAENTYATLMYMTLAAIPVSSVHLDHLASHIGKAAGIVATLRGIPVLAAPVPTVRSPAGADVSSARGPALLLPLDVMAEVGLREEDVFRCGREAAGLQDAVFKVATRANDHLITAREMLKSLMSGRGPGHAYEHEGEAGHVYAELASGDEGARLDLKRGFGTFLEAVPVGDYLGRLEAANFDPFSVKSSWKLPWKLWQASRKEQI